MAALELILIFLSWFQLPQLCESFVVPGPGCGINVPLRKLDPEKISENVADVHDFDCVVTGDEKEFGTVMEKIQIEHCRQDQGACVNVKGYTFVSGGIGCNGDNIKVIQDQNDEISEPVQCSLVANDVLKAMREESISLSLDLCIYDNEHCESIEGYHYLARRFQCGRSVQVSLLNQAPASWNGVDCRLIPQEIYEQELDNIKIAWCLEEETGCHDLPQGYSYESGPDCGSATQIAVLESAEDSVTPEDIVCMIMPPDVFAELQDDLIVKHCLEQNNCDQVPMERLADKSQWDAYGTSMFRSSRPDLYSPDFAIDDILIDRHIYLFVTAKAPYHWLQIDLNKTYFVPRIVIETRIDCCAQYDNHFEARVGMVDTSGFTNIAILTVNQICSSGDATTEDTKDYLCPRPLKGRYVTVQRIVDTNWDTAINEVEVYAVTA